MKNNVVDSIVKLVVDLEFLDAIKDINIKPSDQPINTLFKDWDVKLNDEIEYFDSTLSYEITGYRPVDEERGLDFNPNWFTQAKQYKLNTGHYCPYRPGTKKNVEFWREEYRRCNEGLTINGYTITGDNYFFLNYYRLKDVQVESAGTGRMVGFPSFFSKQYEYFHYVDICRKTGHDVIALKARGVGFSEIAASLGVRLYTTVRNANIVYTAFSTQFLTKLLDKCWTQLEFLNSDTEGGMKHLRQKYNSDMHKRASMLNKDREEYGWMSDIQGIVADEPRKLRGDRVDLLFFEECFGKGTEVRMADYSIKNIEDIEVGDYVLGIDSEPHKVIHTNSGIAEMDTISSLYSRRKYHVKRGHTLCFLKYNSLKQCDLTIHTKSDTEMLNEHIFYRKPIPPFLKGLDIECDIDPEILGAYLVNGTKNLEIFFRKEDKDRVITIDAYNKFKKIYGKFDRRLDSSYIRKILTNKAFRTHMEEHNLPKCKFLPPEIYKTNYKYRLKVLASMINLWGIKKHFYGTHIDYYLLRLETLDGYNFISDLCTSLGLITRKSRKQVIYFSYILHYDGYLVDIYGDLRNIPVKEELVIDEYDRSFPYFLNDSISIRENDIEEEYFGITLEDKGNPKVDNLFLLEDGTIVHNCGSFKGLIKTYLQSNALVEILGSKFGVRFCWGYQIAPLKFY